MAFSFQSILIFFALKLIAFSLQMSNKEANVDSDNMILNYSSSNKPIIKVIPLNDNHEQLVLLWAGNDSRYIICLAKNRPNANDDSSSVYFSLDGGDSYNRVKELQYNEKEAIISTFYISPSSSHLSFFVDVINQNLFVSQNFGKSFKFTKLSFKPQLLMLHHSDSNKLLAFDNSKLKNKLWISKNTGQDWKYLTDNVIQFTWGSLYLDHPNTLFILKKFTSNHSSLITSSDFLASSTTLLNNVEKFIIKDDYIFAIKKLRLFGSKSHRKNVQLWISFKRKPFELALLPNFEKKYYQDFRVIDVTENVIMINTIFQDSSSILMIAKPNQFRFIISLKDVLYSWPNLDQFNVHKATQSFTDVHKIAGLEAIYIANYQNQSTNESFSVITFDNGFNWRPLSLPLDKNGKQLKCEKNFNCSLHLTQKLNQPISSLKYPLLLSTPSFLGLIVSPGVINTSYQGKPKLFVSIDAGLSWRQVLSGNYLFEIGASGAIIMAVKHFSKAGGTNQIIFSLDKGYSWKSIYFMNKNETLRVYNLLTEPSKKSAVFTLFGARSNSSKHDWIIVKINMTSMLKSECSDFDYQTWALKSSLDTNCNLGKEMTFLRLSPNSSCINTKNLEKPIKVINCPCSRIDYHCDYGYAENNLGQCVPLNDPEEFTNDHNTNACLENQSFYKTQGFEKIFGNTCKGGKASSFEPLLVSCINKNSIIDKSTTNLARGNTQIENGYEVFPLVIFSIICIMIIFIYFFRNRRNFSNLRKDYFNNCLGSKKFSVNASFANTHHELLDYSDDDLLMEA